MSGGNVGRSNMAPQPVEGLESAWRDEFAGTAVDATKWTIATRNAGGAIANPTFAATGNGMTVSVAGSKLTIATGVTSGDEVELISQAFARPPVRLYAVLDSISQRIANQEFSIELVEVGAVSDGGSNRAGFFYSGTTATNCIPQTWSQGDNLALASQNILTTASASIAELDLTPEEAWFYSTAVDSAAARSNAYRISRKTPDPSKLYAVRIRAKNTGVPSSTTSFALDSIMVENYTHSAVEVTRGRGNAAAGEQIAVTVASSTVELGLVANDGVDAGNPVKIGGKAFTTAQAAVSAANDRVNAMFDLVGRIVQLPYALAGDTLQGRVTVATLASDTQLIAAQAAGVRTYVTDLVVANTGATAATVDLKDGATAIATYRVPPGETRVSDLTIPLRGSAATAVNVNVSAGGDINGVTVTCTGFKSSQ